MEAYFDNKANLLDARIRATHDDSIIYTIVTIGSIWGRRATYIKDANPAPGDSIIVGAIHWKEKAFEIYGHRRPLKDIRRKTGRFTNKTKLWRWSAERKEYEVAYRHDEEWQIHIGSSVNFAPAGEDAGQTPPKTKYKNMAMAGRLVAPFRPQLFGKLKPISMQLTGKALAKDEVFLIMVLIFSEVRRQESMNCSGGW